MKYPSYKAAIAWIANNDSCSDDGNNNPQTVSELVTSCMIADIFEVDHLKVGRDVCKMRLKNGDITEIDETDSNG
jgi:hypothetical protein